MGSVLSRRYLIERKYRQTWITTEKSWYSEISFVYTSLTKNFRLFWAKIFDTMRICDEKCINERSRKSPCATYHSTNYATVNEASRKCLNVAHSPQRQLRQWLCCRPRDKLKAFPNVFAFLERHDSIFSLSLQLEKSWRSLMNNFQYVIIISHSTKWRNQDVLILLSCRGSLCCFAQIFVCVWMSKMLNQIKVRKKNYIDKIFEKN